MKPSTKGHSPSVACLALVAVLVVGCIVESGKEIREKLDAFLPGELTALLNGLPRKSWADSTYFEVRSYEPGKKGRYTVKAEVDFHILRNVPKRVVCKYRYHASVGLWERYTNEWRSYEDSTRAQDRH